MTREELLVEISIIKHRLASEAVGPVAQQSLLVALIALYDCLVQMDNALIIQDALTSWEAPIRRYTNDYRKAA
jgi:hypothetical protein